MSHPNTIDISSDNLDEWNVIAGKNYNTMEQDGRLVLLLYTVDKLSDL